MSDPDVGNERVDEFELRRLQDDDSFGSMRSGDERFAPLKMFAKKVPNDTSPKAWRVPTSSLISSDVELPPT